MRNARAALSRLLVGGVLALFTVGCTHVMHLGPPTGSPQRIWVKKGDKVYRCADGAGNDEVPKPICVQAPFTRAR